MYGNVVTIVNENDFKKQGNTDVSHF